MRERTRRHSRSVLAAALAACWLSAAPASGGQDGLQGDSGAFVALAVVDFDGMVAWYRNHLEFRVVSEGGNAARRGALLSRPGMLLEIVQPRDAKPPNDADARARRGIIKIGFLVPDLDASFERVRSERLDVAFPIVRADAGLRTFAIRDPERNIIQFVGK